MQPVKHIVTENNALANYPHKEVLTDIPSSDLSQVIIDFESEGAKVNPIQQSSGKWAVEALFYERD